eukprot:403363737
MDNLTNLESLSKHLNLEKSLDFIQFKTSFIDNFDFERLTELARGQLIKRTGSRSATWKMMLGVIPNINDKEVWTKTLKENRERYGRLQDKYMKLNSQINTPNPLALLNNPDMAKEIFSMKEDREIKILIKKDVERTMQELELFKDKFVQLKMEEVLYLWAKEYPEFKYQQGMNEILAVLVLCVISELHHDERQQSEFSSGKQESDDEEGHSSHDEDDQGHDYNKKLFREMHDPKDMWADIYCMFENLMNLGVKDLYYKDIIQLPTPAELKQKQNSDKKIGFRDDNYSSTKDEENKQELQRNQNRDIKAYTQYSSLSSQSSGLSIAMQKPEQISKEKQRRLRKQKLLELNQEDAKKTALKKRSNKIFSKYLREIDPELFNHIQEIDLQPELILLKYLRCLLSREFTPQSLLYVWDFIIQGIDEQGRIYLQELKQTQNHHQDESSHDFIKSLDYICLSMVQLQRNYLIESDYIGCLKLTSRSQRLDCHNEVIRIADRIGKILFDKMIKKDNLIQKDEFPRILEQDVEKFMQEYSLRHESDEESDVGSSLDNSGIIQPRKCFKVKEESEEEENSEIDSVGELSISNDRMKDVDEVVESTMIPKQGSIVIDEDGDTFVDCTNDLVRDNHSDEDEKEESFHSIDDANLDAPLEDADYPTEDINKKLFKLKDTKGKVIYDHQTKQRRFMSPFEQFIAEQEGLFKKDELRQNDEQNSATLTTTASTQFDSKTLVIHSLNSGSGSLIEEPITLPKKASQVMRPNNKLAKMANILQIDAQVKQVEDCVMQERKQNIKQLRNIKGYLSGIKTGRNSQILEKVQRAQRITANGGESKSIFSFLF